ncbi:MAG: DUF3473 domain-containing protein [candidate division Zixibacteria bacterium]|nr:DUF3473 domain-containing protein [candidate division Zixibacteria bacterium]
MEELNTTIADEILAENQPEFTGHILAIEINDFIPAGKKPLGNRSRVIPNILHLLDYIDKHRVEGNFYTTPELMRDFPEIVSLVSSRGHEIGLCCDYRDSKNPEDFHRYKDELELIINRKTCGIMLKSDLENVWQRLKMLASDGFYYSVTDFHSGYLKDISFRKKLKFDNNSCIHIFPSSRFKFWGINIEFGQPGRIRLYPYWFLRRCLRHFTQHHIPAIINFPLWEFDPHLPKQSLNPLKSLRSYGNLTLAEFKLTQLLLEFDFVRITRYLDLENSDDK